MYHVMDCFKRLLPNDIFSVASLLMCGLGLGEIMNVGTLSAAVFNNKCRQTRQLIASQLPND
jgi:hypothetical protein